jgi:hypothetical protein
MQAMLERITITMLLPDFLSMFLASNARGISLSCYHFSYIVVGRYSLSS